MDPSTETIMDSLPDPPAPESSSIPPETNEEFPAKMDELILDKPGESLAEQAQEPLPSTLNKTDQTKCTCCPLEFNSEMALFEHEILCHNKTEFECKTCQFTSSDTAQFRSHLAAHYVTSAVEVKSSLNNPEIPVFSQLQTSQDDCNPNNNNASLAPDDDIILLASSDQIAPKNRKGRRPSGKLPRHPITIDGRYMCKAPGCDFSTKYEFNLTRHEVRHGKRKAGGTKPKSTKTWRNSSQSKKFKAKENNSYSLPKPLEEPLGILKSVLLSPTKSLETAGAAEEPTETKHPSESPKSVISSWIEDRNNQQNGKTNGRKNDDDEDDDDNKYFKSSSGKYKCKKCYYTTSFKCNMKKHFPTHSNDLPYKCHYCDYRSRWEQNVKAHEKSQHFGIPRKYKPSTTTTKKVRTKKKKPNEMAKKIVKTEPNDMIKVTKNADSEIVAKVGPPELITIEPVVEGKDKKIEQDKSKRRLSSEIVEEADGNFYCKECNYVSKDKRLLISHLKRHSDERPFPCNFPGCAYRTKWSHWARAHERNVHGFNRFENVKSKKAGKWKPTTFAGTMESRRFQLGLQIGEIVQGSSSPLTIKLEEPFTKKLEGPFAKKLEGPFAKKLEGPFTKKLVKKEPKIKTNEKLVQSALEMVSGAKASEKINCPECGMKCLPRFLQRHLMVHSDEKPYVCAAQGCDYRTRWPGDLKVHMKRHGPAVNKRQKNLLKKSSFRQVTSSAKTAIVMKTCASGNVKRFKCPDCEYHGATGWHVNRHRLTHGNVPPLCCPEVGCSFTTRDRRYLVKHQIEFHAEGQGQGSLTTRRVAGQWDAEDKDCRFCEYLKKVAFYVRRYVKGCPGCKKPTALLDQPEVDNKSVEIEEEKKNNEKTEAGMDLELADSSGFACMLCDFVGDSEGAALEHAKCHPQPAIKINKLEMIVAV